MKAIYRMGVPLSLVALWGAAAVQWACAAEPATARAYVTNQGGGVSVLDLETLRTIAHFQVGKDPRGLAVTPDGRLLVTANQVDSDISLVDAQTGVTKQRIAVGKNAEFVRISPDGRFAYVTYEPSSTGKPPGPGESSAKGEMASPDKGDKDSAEKGKPASHDEAPEPAEIAVVDLAKATVAARLPASLETEGMDFSPDGRDLVVANEGDDTVVVYDRASGKAIKRIDISSFGKRPRGVKAAADGSRYLVSLESSDNFLVLDADFNVIKAVPTGKGPYGIAFEPGGARIWVAAARASQMQVFDAKTFAVVATIPIGKRCWHFSFTPDSRRVLAACGRSDAITVIDVSTHAPVSTLTGFEQPWGIITYPKADGSLDRAPAAAPTH